MACYLELYPEVKDKFDLEYTVHACSYTAMTTDMSLTERIVEYTYTSEQKTISFDRIVSTSPECKYSEYTYYLSVVDPNSETLESLGITINNDITPAELSIYQQTIEQDKLVSLSWWAIPKANQN